MSYIPVKTNRRGPVIGMERWKQVLRRKVPILDWGMRYKVSWFAQDLLAGFTVGLTEIPQGIAYASVAGMILFTFE